MDRVGPGLERSADLLGGVEIRGDLDRLTGASRVAGAAVVGGDHGDRLDPEPLAGPEDANCDLAAVRNDEPADGHGAHSMQSHDGFGAARRGYNGWMRVLVTFLLRSSWRRCRHERVRGGPSLAYGIQDDAWLEYGPARSRSASRRCSASGSTSSASPFAGMRSRRRRARSTGPGTDAVLEQLHDAGIDAVVTLYGTPSWANGGKGPNVAPAPRRRLRGVRRRSGRAIPVRAPLDDLERAEPAPLAVDGLAGAVRDPAAQPGVCRDPLCVARRRRWPAASRLRAAERAGCPRSRSSAGWGRAARASTRTPTIRTRSRRRRRRGAEAATTARRSRWRRSAVSSTETQKAFKRPVRLWLTELGYQSNPPDRLLGVAPAVQASYIAARRLQGLGDAARRSPDPVPLPRRADPRSLAERSRLAGRQVEARARRLRWRRSPQVSAQGLDDGRVGRRSGPGAARGPTACSA